MKLGENTIAVLKNYSRMNQGLKVEPGNIISSMTAAKTVVSKSKVDTEFEKGFCIYNLHGFLGVLSLFNDPDIEIMDDAMHIIDGNKNVVYRFASESMIVFPSEEQFTILDSYDDVIVEFDLTQEDISTIIKAAHVLSLPNVVFAGEFGDVFVRSTGVKDPGSNNFNIHIGKTDKTFLSVIDKNYLVLLTPDDYRVSILGRTDGKGNRVLAKFTSANQTNWIATESIKS